ATVDDFWLIEDGTVRPFDGDLDEYTKYSQQKRSEENSALRNSSSAVDRKAQKKLEADARQRNAVLRKPVEKKLAKVEKDMAGFTAEMQKVVALLAEESLYLPARAAELKTARAKEAELKSKLDPLEALWLEISDELEALR
ncbi:MAG: ABC transporter, partial [Burkholderiales bacterium]|nr:ABC transporter [Burkholderiales bacterium]